MRILNVVYVKDLVVEEIKTYPIFEENMSLDIIKKAEKVFEEWIRECIDPNDYEADIDELILDFIDDGSYYDIKTGESVSIVWTNTNHYRIIID